MEYLVLVDNILDSKHSSKESAQVRINTLAAQGITQARISLYGGNQLPFDYNPPLPPIGGDYFCDKIEVLRGQITSGDHTSLHNKTMEYPVLVVKSALQEGYYYIDWYAEYTLPSRQVTTLSLSYTGKYSTWRGQSLLLYNFTISAWRTVDYRTVGASIVNFNLASIANPTDYVSENGKVRVRLYSFSLVGFTAYTDYLKINVQY